LQNLQTFPVTDISHVGHHHENCCKNVKIAAKKIRGTHRVLNSKQK